MRIVAGSRRGARLYTGRAAGFRPTSDRVREAIFSILGDSVRDRRVLDLYAGSGALGLEALSRGAVEALFVEKNRRIASWIEGNAVTLRFDEVVRVRAAEVLRFLRGREDLVRFDLVFADPPYGAGLVEPTLAAIETLEGPRRVVLEREKREPPQPGRPSWREAATYGDTVVEFLVFGGPEEGEESP